MSPPGQHNRVCLQNRGPGGVFRFENHNMS
jgi:hypothetical protein